MTEEEKKEHPECEVIGGYLKVVDRTDSDRQMWWDSLSDEDKREIRRLPNFSPAIFEMCTGIKPE